MEKDNNNLYDIEKRQTNRLIFCKNDKKEKYDLNKHKDKISKFSYGKRYDNLSNQEKKIVENFIFKYVESINNYSYNLYPDPPNIIDKENKLRLVFPGADDLI